MVYNFIALQSLVKEYSETNMVTELNKSLAQYMKRVKKSFDKFLTKLAGKKTVGIPAEQIHDITANDSDSQLEESSREASSRRESNPVRFI
jgi:predicted CopG family antitoxin